MKQFLVSAARRAIRIGKVLLAVVLVLGLIHSAATVILGRKVEAEINALRARGEWVTLAQAAGPKVPAGENGAPAYAPVFKRLNDPKAQKDIAFFREIRDGKVDRLNIKAWDTAGVRVSKYQDVMALISKAAEYRRYSFPVDWSHGIHADISHVVGLHRASLLCMTDAITKARDGRMDEAVRSIELCMRPGDAVKDESFSLSQVVRGMCVQNACKAIDQALGYGRITDDQARRLSERLAAVDIREGYDRSIKGELALALWITKYMQDHRVTVTDLVGNSGEKLTMSEKLLLWSTGRYVSRPLLYADQLGLLRARNQLIEAASLDRKGPASVRDTTWRGPFCSFWPDFLNAYRPSVYRNMVSIAETRTALGLHVYRNRNGAYPASLDELRAGEKWQVPTDPYTGEDLIYKRRGNGFTLYSIGPNGKDDGGKADDIAWGAKAS